MGRENVMEVKFYDTVNDELLKFAVIISQSNGKWVFCKHKERDTYEVPGGHREAGEDMITIMVILVSMAIAIYFGDWIKEVLPINLLFLLLFVQLVYVGIRWYVKGWRENRGYV